MAIQLCPAFTFTEEISWRSATARLELKLALLKIGKRQQGEAPSTREAVNVKELGGFGWGLLGENLRGRERGFCCFL